MFEFGSEFFAFMLIGFAAQIIDGALGMAYGTLSASILLGAGLPPVTVSASVHAAQIATTGMSAVSHAYFKNVNWPMCMILGLFGALGGVAGATILVNIDGDLIKPYIVTYLMGLGLFMLWKLWRQRGREPAREQAASKRYTGILGFVGGLLDSIGGGGWGPVVTSNLMAKGENPRLVIGSVNTAECFVKTCTSLAFVATVGFIFTDVVVGLLIGGVLAAPLGAYVVRLIPARILMLIVAMLITALSVWQITQYFL